MRSLGRNGRFGNQLLQYAFLRLYAQEHKLVAECPDWIGRDIYDLDDPLPSTRLPTLTETTTDFFGSLHRRTGQVFAGTDVKGFFCGNTSSWGNLRSRFHELFTPAPKIQEQLQHALARLHLAGKTIVAIHLRRGDFGYGRYWVAPSSWYVAWLRRIWSKLEQPVLFIASDTDDDHSEFAEFVPRSATRLGVDIPGANFVVDHHILRHAEHLAISNSTFSFTAAMLNPRALTFVRPTPDLHELVSFEPWSAPVLIDATVALLDIPGDEQLFVRNHLRDLELAVHWGSYCSAWTNLARLENPRLMVVEAESESSLLGVLRRRSIQRIPLLVLEDAGILDQFLQCCDKIFQEVRVDMVLLRPMVESRTPALSRFAAVGYDLARLSEITKSTMSSHQSKEYESYLALRNPKN